MRKHIRTELIKCKNCGHVFWSKYHCPPSRYTTEKQPVCDECGSEWVEHIGYRERINE